MRCRAREFQGRVSTIAAALGTAKLVPRGPKRPNDLDTLEVLIEVTGDGLLPGMRVDVFFKPDEPAAQAPAAAPASAPARAAAAAPTQPAAKSATSSATPSTTVK